MGASNFYNKNASRIFACELEDEDSYYWLRENLEGVLCDDNGFDSIDGGDNDRNYTLEYVAEKRVSFSYKDFTVYATIKAGIRSAYYDGCNLDWDLEYDWDCGYNEEMTPDFFERQFLVEDLMHNLSMTGGQARRHSVWASKKLEQLGQGLIKELEAIYAKHCGMELKRVATFSNGESIYEQVS